MMGLFTSYELTFLQCFKNALVIIANNLVIVPVVAIVSALPLGLCAVNNFLGFVIYAAMALLGCTFMALCWIAMVDRGMVKCHNRKAEQDKSEQIEKRRAAKQNPQTNGQAKNVGNQKKKNTAQKPYQNPKKKKKK